MDLRRAGFLIIGPHGNDYAASQEEVEWILGYHSDIDGVDVDEYTVHPLYMLGSDVPG